MNPTIVNKTSAEVEKYNTENKACIEAGLMVGWVQSEDAKYREDKAAKAKAAEELEKQKWSNAIAPLHEINIRQAKAHGLTSGKYTIDRCYGHSNSMYRSNTLIGVTLKVGGWEAKARNYKFNSDNQLNLKRIESVFEEYYHAEKFKLCKKAEKDAAMAAANEEMPAELLKRIGRVTGKTDKLEAIKAGDMIKITYGSYSGGFGHHRGTWYTYQIATPRTVSQWVQFVELHEKFSKELNDLAIEAAK